MWHVGVGLALEYRQINKKRSEKQAAKRMATASLAQ
jgi:hypothetical protein